MNILPMGQRFQDFVQEILMRLSEMLKIVYASHNVCTGVYLLNRTAFRPNLFFSASKSIWIFSLKD